MVSDAKLTSPTVVRLNSGAREGKGSGKETSAVSRCLFGRPDPSDTSRMLADFAARMKEEAAVRWNFDFQTLTPLPGRWDWQATDVRRSNNNNNDDDDYNDEDDDKEGDFAYSMPETCGMTSVEGRLCLSEAVHTEMSQTSRPCSFSSSSSSEGVRGISKSVPTPTEKQTKCFVRANLKRLIAAPKKKTSGLNETLRRQLRQSLTITEYFPIRKQGPIGARRHLKL